jgi:hypothetical protein
MPSYVTGEPRLKTSSDRCSFVQALTQSFDPVVIPALVVALKNAGGPPEKALARFGDQSIAPLIGAAASSTKRSVRRFVPARRMLDHPSDDPVAPLSSSGRQQIVSFALEVWRRPRLDTDAIPLTELAPATVDAALRHAVMTLASGPAARRAAGVSSPIASGYFQQALERHPPR